MSMPFQTLEDWGSRLHYFQFKRAIGGHANDADTIIGKILFKNESELLEIFEKLQIPLQIIPEGKERVVKGKTYTSAEYDKVAHPVWAYPAYQEPSRKKIFEISVFFEIQAQEITLVLSGADGNSWDITEQDFENALQLESEFEQLGIQMQVKSIV
jgi:hypothetical protein